MMQNKNMQILVCFFLCMAYLDICHASVALSQEDAASLEIFFRELIQEDTSGYVLYDRKPVSINGFFQSDIDNVDTETHRASVALKEGARVWENLAFPSKNILIHVYKKNDTLVKGCKHILTINRMLFLDVVKSNIHLFQYILGPKVTPESLLDALIKPQNAFHEVLNNNKVLIGIILGFGTHNAIHYSRLENIHDGLIEYKDNPPYLNKLRQFPKLFEQFKDLLLFDFVLYSNAHLLPYHISPSFGFKSLSEEYVSLSDEGCIASPSLCEQSPNFIFGCLPKLKENPILISQLENAQVKIQTLLKSPTFLKDVLKIITGEDFSVNISQRYQLPIKDNERKRINEIAAKEIWSELKIYPEEYISAFIEAIRHPQSDIQLDNLKAYGKDYKHVLSQAKKNFDFSKSYFERLSEDTSLTCIVPKKLYYKVLDEGTGRELVDEILVGLKYQIFDPQNSNLIDPDFYNAASTLDLSKVIPSFAHGVKGMRIGETREIFIHPCLAYGIYTTLQKGIYLRCKVTLIDIQSTSKKIIQPLENMDLSLLLEPDLEKLYEKDCIQTAKLNGGRLGRYLTKSDLLKVKDICQHLQQMHKGNIQLGDLLEDEAVAINRVYWNIYYGSRAEN